jgi:1-deoxy-D-xylulose-5-phosphate synthase
MTIMAPKDENELQHLLRTAVEHPGPAAIRFPRGAGHGVALDPDIKAIPMGEAELLRDGNDAAVIVFGTLAQEALEAAVELGSEGHSVAVLNARFAKPLDSERILRLARQCSVLVTVEEHSVVGGFGSAVRALLAEEGIEIPTRVLGIPDRMVEHGDPKTIRREIGLDREGIVSTVAELLSEGGGRAPSDS